MVNVFLMFAGLYANMFVHSVNVSISKALKGVIYQIAVILLCRYSYTGCVKAGTALTRFFQINSKDSLKPRSLES